MFRRSYGAYGELGLKLDVIQARAVLARVRAYAETLKHSPSSDDLRRFYQETLAVADAVRKSSYLPHRPQLSN